jgi:hypothetical protein
VEVLGCAPQSNLNHLLKIWFATLRRRVFSQAFRNQFPPVKELSVINVRKHFNEVTVLVSKLAALWNHLVTCKKILTVNNHTQIFNRYMS